MSVSERELETAKLLGRIDANVAQILSDNKEIKGDIDKLKADHASLKSRVNYIAGGLAAAVTFITIFKDTVVRAFSGS